MAFKEKGGSVASRPIPKCVLPDNAEYTSHRLHLQASRLVRLYAVNAAMAETIAPLVFLEVLR
jgi:hypothetical protein